MNRTEWQRKQINDLCHVLGTSQKWFLEQTGYSSKIVSIFRYKKHLPVYLENSMIQVMQSILNDLNSISGKNPYIAVHSYARATGIDLVRISSMIGRWSNYLDRCNWNHLEPDVVKALEDIRINSIQKLSETIQAFRSLPKGEKMDISITALNEYLFEQLNNLSNDNLDAESLEFECKRAGAIQGIADKIIQNNETVLKAAKLRAEYSGEFDVPMLETHESTSE